MSEPWADPAGARLPPVLAAGAEFSGLVVLHGVACIEGRVSGEIVGADVLRIGETGGVEARVEAGEVIVAGAVEGQLKAGRRVVLEPTARVRGRIVAPRLALAEGCVFEGDCRTGALGAPEGVAAPEGPGSP